MATCPNPAPNAHTHTWFPSKHWKINICVSHTRVYVFIRIDCNPSRLTPPRDETAAVALPNSCMRLASKAHLNPPKLTNFQFTH